MSVVIGDPTTYLNERITPCSGCAHHRTWEPCGDEDVWCICELRRAEHDECCDNAAGGVWRYDADEHCPGYEEATPCPSR